MLELKLGIADMYMYMYVCVYIVENAVFCILYFDSIICLGLGPHEFD